MGYATIQVETHIKRKSLIMYDFDNNNHSVFLLSYHLVLVIKYRRKVITKEIKIGSGYKIRLQEWGYEEDHVHMLFRTNPDTRLTKFINVYKSSTSRKVKILFPYVKIHLWKEYFWFRHNKKIYKFTRRVIC